MFSGHNFIGFKNSANHSEKIKVFSTVNNGFLPEEFTCAAADEIEEAAQKAATAFDVYKKTSYEDRALFLETIASEIINIGDVLVQRAMLESGLPAGRLNGERDRTINQLKLFASLLREGSWVDAVIDTALPDRKPLPRVDLRRMLLPIGPVLVFGASNFPFAFSTAGGDTASALAAGCTVIVKAHPAHLGTNELVANAIIMAAQKCNMPDGVFSSLIGKGNDLGQSLAKHPLVKAIAFTGSYRGGTALMKTAVNYRQVPIPVYAEMSSVNPVIALPARLGENSETAASLLAGSILLGTGQFCTNPGLIFLIDGPHAENFVAALAGLLPAAPKAVMLTEGISKNYYAELQKLREEKGVKSIVECKEADTACKGSAALLEVSATNFISNPALQNEVFGPSSLIVRCKDQHEMLQALNGLHGQLTGTVLGTSADAEEYKSCIEALTEKVGRLLFNGVPTGVEVSHAMVHGGPFPATTDAKFTSVGTDAIKRFVRPVCFQDCPEIFLPEPLKNNNPLGIMRKVNGTLTRDAVIV